MKTSDGILQSRAGLPNLAGLVLCGGESRRMGSDKGLLRQDGIPWAVYMGHKLIPWQLPVFCSINARQKAAYGALFPAKQLITDALGLPGPLEGLFSAHVRFPGIDWLLLACDMPDLDGPTIQGVIDAYRKDERNDFYVYEGSARGSDEGGPGSAETARGPSFVQPFCGIYTSAGLAAAYASYRGKDAKDGGERGGAGDLSLQLLLKAGRTQRLPLDRADAFRNYNSL